MEWDDPDDETGTQCLQQARETGDVVFGEFQCWGHDSADDDALSDALRDTLNERSAALSALETERKGPGRAASIHSDEAELDTRLLLRS